jgi:phage terminase large subunit-like protein
MDVAWTTSETADYTAIAVIGIDHEENIYLLDLMQFKTSSFTDYYDNIITLHRKWGFRKLRVETNSGGSFVKQELERLIRQNGDTLSVEGRHQLKNQGSKTERKGATLEWRYADQRVWHYKDGIVTDLEDQIILNRPRHDDLLDAFVAAIDISKAPGKRNSSAEIVRHMDNNIVYDRRFGGRRSRVA